MSRFTMLRLAAPAAGLALVIPGLAGGVHAAIAAAHSAGPPAYNSAWAGYTDGGGRWFRYVAASVTIPRSSSAGTASLWLQGRGSPTPTQIGLPPGDGQPWYADPGGTGTFRISTRAGDRVSASIYYDRNGHDYLTVTDITQHTAQTIRTIVPSMTYMRARVFAAVGGSANPPQADTRLWHFTDCRVTTYTGIRGTLLGPWTTTPEIVTTTSTAAGTVIASPSGLSAKGADFTAWRRALPLTYTQSFAGYVTAGRTFRYVATVLTVPPAAKPPANGGTAAISLLHTGGATPRPYARIEVKPGGGPGSISYDTSTAAGTFAITPQPGDQVAISIYYDRHGHDHLTAADLTSGTSEVITRQASPVITTMPYNIAWLAGIIDNSAATSPPADTRIWAFSGSHVTTYNGDHGTIIGPWATTEETDTTTGTAAGNVVMNAPILRNGAQNFSVWLRQR